MIFITKKSFSISLSKELSWFAKSLSH